MTNFSIGPTPLQIIGVGVNNQPLTVQNSGTVSIYISADPGVSAVAYEYKIDAGGDFVWPPNKALSVCTAKNVVGQISFGGTGDVHVNSGSTNVTGAVTINGTVPISGPVTVTGTVALNAGATVAIAGTVPISGGVTITSGTVGLSGPVSITGGVSVTGSTININGTVPTTSSSATVILATATVAVTASTTPQAFPFLDNGSVGLSNIDVSAYRSITLTVDCIMAGYATVLTAYIKSNLSFSNGATLGGSSAAVNAYEPQWLLTNTAQGFSTGDRLVQSITLPVTARYLHLGTVLFKNVSPGQNGTVNLVITGSNALVLTPVYVSRGLDYLPGLVASGTVAVNRTATATTTNILETRNGDTEIDVALNTAVACQVALQSVNNGVGTQFFSLLPATSTAGNTLAPNKTRFAYLPIVLVTTVNAGGNLSLGLVQ